MESWNILYSIVLLLGASLVLGTIFAKLRQSPLLGYLLAGAFLGGEGSLNVVESTEEIEAIAELGVTLLLFSLGLEFSWKRLRELGTASMVAGALQVVVTVAVAFAVALLFGLGAAEAAVVGAMVSLSSTAVILKVLVSRGELDSVHGRRSLAILLVQDMAVVPLAVLVALLEGGGSPARIATEVGRVAGLAAGLVGVLYLLLNQIAVRVLGTLTVARNRELSTLLAVVVGLGSSWAAHAVGTSPALGAFVAGMFLAASPFATQVRADVSSLRTVLLTLFFGAAGMVADPIWMAKHAHIVLGLTALLVAGKTAIIWALLRLTGTPSSRALATGLCLAQIGEFAFVLGALGMDAGLLANETYLAVVSSAIVTLFLSPYLVGAAPRVGLLFERVLRGGRGGGEEADGPATHRAPDVVVIGFGPAGQEVARAITTDQATVVAIDLNPDAREAARNLGVELEIGDACQLDVLEHAGVGRAKVVVVTVPAPMPALAAVETIRSLVPAAQVLVRARHQRDVQRFELAGAHQVTDEEHQVGKALAVEARFRLSRARRAQELREHTPTTNPVEHPAQQES